MSLKGKVAARTHGLLIHENRACAANLRFAGPFGPRKPQAISDKLKQRLLDGHLATPGLSVDGERQVEVPLGFRFSRFHAHLDFCYLRLAPFLLPAAAARRSYTVCSPRILGGHRPDREAP